MIIALWPLPDTICRLVMVTFGTAVAVNVTVLVASLATVAVTVTGPEAAKGNLNVFCARPLESVEF